MLTFTKLWHGAIYVVAAMLVISSVAVQIAANRQVAAVSGDCGTNTLFIKPNAGEVLSGQRLIEVKIDQIAGSTITEIGSVRFFARSLATGTSSFIGSGTPTSTGTWSHQWDTIDSANGQTELTARVSDKAGNPLCTAGPIGVLIDNQTNTSGASGKLELLRKAPTTRDIFMITNYSRVFEVRAVYDDGTNLKDVTTAVKYNWALDGKSVGSIPNDSSQPAVQYKSGPNPGEARIIVNAQYLDRSDTLVYDIIVESADDSTYPESSSDDSGSTSPNIDDDSDSTTSDDSTRTSESSTTLKQREASNPELKACLIEVLGESEYRKLVSGERRLSYKELTQVDRCFADTNFVLPANIAPIEPERVDALPTNTRLAEVVTAEQVSRDSGTEAILLSGTSIPNTSLVIYIFSEPLVLTTKTDGDGNWTYILEDPLEPGEHQVYVTVENGDEVVRSEPFAFSVTQAASIETNPTGLSLTLGFSNTQQGSMIVYISGVVAIVLIGLGLYIFVIRRKGDFVDIDDTEDPITKIKI